jgi:hypothetical protein
VSGRVCNEEARWRDGDGGGGLFVWYVMLGATYPSNAHVRLCTLLLATSVMGERCSEEVTRQCCPNSVRAVRRVLMLVG